MRRNAYVKSAIIAGLICIALASWDVSAKSTIGRAQDAAKATNADDPKFAKFVYDVVSIKPFKEDPNATSRWMGSKDSADGFVMHDAPFTMLISRAYRTEHSKLAGAPDWINKEHFEVEAKMDSEVSEAFQKLSPADQILARQHMLRVLVRDYLKLSFHMDTTEVPIFTLVVGKNGSKLTQSADANAPDAGMRFSGEGGASVCTAKSVPVAGMLPQFSVFVGRPVYDGTGLAGKYDFKLRFTPERPGSAGPDAGAPPEVAPTFAIALEEQLGLKLVPGKGAMDVIVIDHVERPSMN